MSDLMSVRLHLSGVCVRRVLVDAVDRLEVEVDGPARKRGLGGVKSLELG